MAKRWYYKDENGNKVPVPQYKINSDNHYTKSDADNKFATKEMTNAADEEDITSENNLLKLKDRSALNGMGYVILRKNKSFSEQVTKENTIYEIRYNFTLQGITITLPKGSVLFFNGGSLTNGTLLCEDLRVLGDYIENFNIKVSGTIATRNFIVAPYSPNIDASKISACTNGVIIRGHVILDSLGIGVNLKTSLSGESGAILEFSENLNIGIEVIEHDNITIENIKLIKNIKVIHGQSDFWYFEAIRTYKCNNFTVRNCVIYGATSCLNNNEGLGDIELTGFRFIDNTVFADFSNIDGGHDNIFPEKDVINVRGVSDVYIERNIINCLNVNRVFKTSGLPLGPTDSIYTVIKQPVNNLFIKDNHIISKTTPGITCKQFIDMYVGTKNVYIENNVIELQNLTNCFENKTTNLYDEDIFITIKGNRITANATNNAALIFLPATRKVHLIFANNIVKWNTSSISPIIIDCYNIGSAKFIKNIIKCSGVEQFEFKARAIELNKVIAEAHKGDIRFIDNEFIKLKYINIFAADNLLIQRNILTTDAHLFQLSTNINKIKIINDPPVGGNGIFNLINTEGNNSIEELIYKEESSVSSRTRVCGGSSDMNVSKIPHFLSENVYSYDNINYFLFPKLPSIGSSEVRASFIEPIKPGTWFFDTTINQLLIYNNGWKTLSGENI